MNDVEKIVSVIHKPDAMGASEDFGDFSKNIKELALNIVRLCSDAKIETEPIVAFGALALASSSLLSVIAKNFEVSREVLFKDYVKSIKEFLKN